MTTVNINVPTAKVRAQSPAGWECSVASAATFVMNCLPDNSDATFPVNAVADVKLRIINTELGTRDITLDAYILSSSAADPNTDDNYAEAHTRVIKGQ